MSNPLNLETTHAESSERIPLVCILSMGSDPTDLILGLAKKKKKEVLSVSMGQGQEVLARRYVNTGEFLCLFVRVRAYGLARRYM